MARVGIIAYGTVEDRARVEALAKLNKKSASAWIVEKIRDEHRKIYGDARPVLKTEPNLDRP